jgi:hypothetical protein
MPSTSRTTTPAHNYSRWNIKGRLGAFAAEHGERFLEKHAMKTEDADLPVTIIPAQPRGGRTWSPDVLTSAPSSLGPRSEGTSSARNEDDVERRTNCESPALNVILEAGRESPTSSEESLVLPAPVRTPSAGSSELHAGNVTSGVP